MLLHAWSGNGERNAIPLESGQDNYCFAAFIRHGKFALLWRGANYFRDPTNANNSR